MNGSPPPQILLVDDDDDDLFLSKWTLTKAGIHTVTNVSDGRDAIRYLEGSGIYADRKRYPFPDFLLLDLKMPGVTGFQVLEWIRRQPTLSSLRVYVLTSSDEDRDRARAARSGAAGYFVKPLSPAHLSSIQGERGSGGGVSVDTIQTDRSGASLKRTRP